MHLEDVNTKLLAWAMASGNRKVQSYAVEILEFRQDTSNRLDTEGSGF